MTRINTVPASVPKPDSVLFGELAIAAGVVGQPVAVYFSESTATVDCELWKYLSEFARHSYVLHVHSQKDVTTLRKAVGHWRLIVVHATRLLNTVAWIVQLHESETPARPAIVSRTVPDAIDDLPTPLLVLRSTADESSSVIRWLMAGRPQRSMLPEGPPTNGMTFDPALDPVTMPSDLPNGRGPKKLRDCQLLAALLSGAWLTKILDQQSPESTGLPTCGRQEYQRVRRLLQSPLLSTADEAVTQLAVDMVGRTNVLLDLKCNPELIEGNPLRCHDGDPTWRIRGGRTRQELTTRNEVADLGNIHSRLIQEIVEFLQNVSGGYAMFQRMGFVRRPPNEREFKSSNWRVLARMLRSWSFKQVRTHFEALRKDGLISGERDSRNAPWRYRLPEELSISSTPFRSLPPASELFPDQETVA
jgi:hypothetical protein